MELENRLASLVIGCALTVHKALGPGLLESAYQACLRYELDQAGLLFESEKPMPLVYKEVRLDGGYRLDFLVAGKLVVEVKALEALHEVHTAQVLTYLRLSGCRLACLSTSNPNCFVMESNELFSSCSVASVPSSCPL